MIKKTEVLLSFPNGANFRGNINTDFYRSFISFLKDLNCFCMDTKCNQCTQAQFCKYYYLTGNNFSEYPGILIDNNAFEKQIYQKNEEKKLIIYWVGDCQMYSSFVHMFIDRLNQRLFGNFFYCKKIEESTLDERVIKCKSILFKTPIEIEDFKEAYNPMVSFYKSRYQCCLSEESVEETEKKLKRIRMGSVHLKTKRININGYVGRVYFEKEVSLPSWSLETGIGKYNFIGGGKYEAKN